MSDTEAIPFTYENPEPTLDGPGALQAVRDNLGRVQDEQWEGGRYQPEDRGDRGRER